MSDRIAGLFLFLFAVWFGYEATHFKVDFMADPIGPKAFPLILAGVMALVSPFLIAKPDEEPKWPHARILITLAVVFVSFIFYAYLLRPVGFVPVTAVEVAIMAALFGGSIIGSLSAGVGISLALYGFFVYALGIPLPGGTIWGA